MSPDTLKEKFLELEYNTLRKEIETSRDRHFKIIAGALVAVPALQIVAKIVEVSKPSGGSGAASTAPSIIAFAILAPLPVIVLTLYVLYFTEHMMR